MVVFKGDFTNRLRKEEKQKERPKGKLYLSECRVPKNSEEKQDRLPK